MVFPRCCVFFRQLFARLWWYWERGLLSQSIFKGDIGEIHITALEVLSILVCLRLWRNFFRGQWILVFCDIMAACQVINTGRSRCDILQTLLKEICFLAAIFEFEIRAKLLEAINNRIADHLFRWHFYIRHEQSFLKLTSEFNLIEYPVEDHHFKLLNDWYFFLFLFRTGTVQS